jgi:hypothetical protein
MQKYYIMYVLCKKAFTLSIISEKLSGELLTVDKAKPNATRFSANQDTLTNDSLEQL